MQVKDRQAAIGVRVRLNIDGVRWTNSLSRNPKIRSRWRRRQGMIVRVSVNRQLARVRWDGCKSEGDYLLLKLLEEEKVDAVSGT